MPTPGPSRSFAALVLGLLPCLCALPNDDPRHRGHVDFSVRSVRDGRWTDPSTWTPRRVPRAGDRVLVDRGTRVVYDASSADVIRLIQVAGTLRFADDRDTLLEVAVLKVQDSATCSESGFACDFEGTSADGEPGTPRPGALPALLVGTPERPIPASHTARIRLRHLEGLSEDDAPALVCCSARMELHGAPLGRTWVKLGRDARPGDRSVTLSEPVTGWRAGDEVIVTGSEHRGQRTFRRGGGETERRTIRRIDGVTVELDEPLERVHFGSGDFRSEVANLSRNVIIESAEPDGVRGHTLYHRFSRGSIGHVRFAHLGKEGVLGRYPIHFHIVGDTMRGSSVIGAAIVDSHNRWITIHGTRYLVVRDCVGYRSVGHGYFLEDGTEIYNLLDRNLGVHAFGGRRLRDQALPFDPNDGAAFWWANGRNTLVRNVSCENDEYGFRYDSQRTSRFDSRMPIVMPDGSRERVDIRTIPISRFEENEAHTEGLYGMVFAGNNQLGGPLGERLDRVDRTGPDSRHPHVLRKLRIWQVHYGLRPQIPSMLIENVSISNAAYGIYRPAFENHVYRDIRIARTSAEPFNRGMDDASTQFGTITVDGLVFDSFYDRGLPLIQMSDNNPTGRAESHFRRVTVAGRDGRGRRALVGRGGGARVDPVTRSSVPVYLHDFHGAGRHVRVITERDRDHLEKDEAATYRREAPLTGEDAVATEVRDVPFPRLLDSVDELPPATVITSARREGGRIVLEGVAHDDGEIASVTVNGETAEVVSVNAGVVDWRIDIAAPPDGRVTAGAVDDAGNRELTPHELVVPGSERPTARF